MAYHALFALIIYFAIVLVIAWRSHQKITSEGQFVLGDRSLNFWVTAISAHASDMSGWLFMGLPAAIFTQGPSGAWICVSLILGMFLSWHFIAPRLRVLSEEKNCLTLSTFFEKRFDDDSGAIRLISAIFSIGFLSYYLAVGMMTMGFLTESLFEIPYNQGILAAGFVIVLYTYYGGYLTIAWTDLFQGLFLLFAVILVPVLAYQKTGGLSQIQEIALAKDISLSLHTESSMGWIDILFTVIAWAPGYFGMPHILIKFMGLKNPLEMNKCKYLGLSWQTLALSAAACTGFVGIAYFPNGISHSELIFIEMTKQLFPAFVASFILCAILAAVMSTMDAQILVVASVLSEDIYKKFIRKRATSEDMLLCSRVSILFISALAIFLAWEKNTTIMDATHYAWSGLGCSYGPLLIASLYMRHANRYGAIAGMLSGGLIAAIWPTFNAAMWPLFKVPAMLPGFLSSLACIILVSKLTALKKCVARGAA
ncbi:MAG: ycgO [Chlamydiales bacterium]|jgi:sodium/proline symporter|nr:ycgO [Chlamydiales bacterium]